ncbi:class I SAM-dependent methyltransferase [Kiloniella laminariae]|uniref:class I SAM-dependent methyltransferase n=1 Tax=Kiloniella laminariae TaxID=454162 RepID=UPI00036DAE3A|nr:class I SAM-dependent methyltransferase [Kiloniella laminariae]
MTDNSPFADPLLARLYDLQNPWGPDCDFYMTLAADLARGKTFAPLRILDIGCGTGLLTTALAQQGHKVTGLDPAAPMLKVARARQDGHLVQWIETTADALPRHCPDQPFDLVIMSGHAFQVFQDDKALQATLQAIRQQLAPDGQLAFETRNPLVQSWKKWTREQTTERFTLSLDGKPETIELWHDAPQFKGDLVSFISCYRFVDQPEKPQGTTHSTIRFLSREKLAQQLNVTDLRIKAF